MISSGTTAIATNGDAAVTLFTVSNVKLSTTLTIINTGAALGFFSTDGTNWGYLPAGGRTIPFASLASGASNVVQIKRVPSGTDMSGVYADAY